MLWLVFLALVNAALLVAVFSWINKKEYVIMSQVQGVVDAVVAQLTKVRDEILDRLDEVEAQVIEAGVAEQVDLSGLQAIADALDAIVPDAAVEAEVEVEYEGLGEVEFEDFEEDVAVDEAVEGDEDEVK